MVQVRVKRKTLYFVDRRSREVRGAVDDAGTL